MRLEAVLDILVEEHVFGPTGIQEGLPLKWTKPKNATEEQERSAKEEAKDVLERAVKTRRASLDIKALSIRSERPNVDASKDSVRRITKGVQDTTDLQWKRAAKGGKVPITEEESDRDDRDDENDEV
jgi:hypothetical protein